MAERFFDLSAADQAELLQSLAPIIGRRARNSGKRYLALPDAGYFVQAAVP